MLFSTQKHEIENYTVCTSINVSAHTSSGWGTPTHGPTALGQLHKHSPLSVLLCNWPSNTRPRAQCLQAAVGPANGAGASALFGMGAKRTPPAHLPFHLPMPHLAGWARRVPQHIVGHQMCGQAPQCPAAGGRWAQLVVQGQVPFLAWGQSAPHLPICHPTCQCPTAQCGPAKRCSGA